MGDLLTISDSLTQAVEDVIRQREAKFLNVLWAVHPHELAELCGGFIGGSAAKRAHFPSYVYFSDYVKVSDLDICIPESSVEIFRALSEKYPRQSYFGPFSSKPADCADPLFESPKFTYNYLHSCNVDVFVLPDKEIQDWKTHVTGKSYMKISKLVEAAREWKREKDLHFVKFVESLSV